MLALETWELLSYAVTVIGLPLTISVFIGQVHNDARYRQMAAAQVTMLHHYCPVKLKVAVFSM